MLDKILLLDKEWFQNEINQLKQTLSNNYYQFVSNAMTTNKIKNDNALRIKSYIKLLKIENNS